MKKKILCAIVAGLFAAPMFAQNMAKTADRVTFGVRAGVNFQNINGKDGAGDKVKNDMITGFNVGVNAEIPVGPGFYLQPGLLYSGKGAKKDPAKTTISYLEVPINFVYKPILGSGNMLLGFGPYLGFGIGGKIKAGSLSLDYTEGYKSFDMGGNLLVGYEFANKLSFQLNAQLGMANILKKEGAGPADKSTAKNTGFGLSFGYRF